MGNIADLFSELNINTKALTKKKQQTDYKIKYVTEYVRQWVIISSERTDISDIVFIDCMCNAGVYYDGDLCTSIEVMQIFSEAAEQHPSKNYVLRLNDIDSEKIDILKCVITKLRKKLPNFLIYISNKDVNEYLEQINNSASVFGYGKSVVLYVDPYDFGTVHIPKVSAILKKHYCELIFNFFISDYTRNWNTDKDRIAACLGGQSIDTKEQLIEYMEKQFKVGKIKLGFSYQFKIITNIELYQIMFFTPNKRGLEVLKDALWKVFNGKFYHRNRSEFEESQMSIFTVQDERQWLLEMHAADARNLLMSQFGRTMTYQEIELLLIEKSMLMESQIIKNVLDPLITAGSIKKLNLVPTKRNYKKDSYEIGN